MSTIQPESTSEQAMHMTDLLDCPKCGASNAIGTRYCDHCGASLAGVKPRSELRALEAGSGKERGFLGKILGKRHEM
jgi:hypothetical protein